MLARKTKAPTRSLDRVRLDSSATHELNESVGDAEKFPIHPLLSHNLVASSFDLFLGRHSLRESLLCLLGNSIYFGIQ